MLSGIDWHFSYRKLCIASRYIQAGAQFIATNPDRNSGDTVITPGSGCQAKAIEVATGVKPIFMGKPSPFAYELIREDQGIKSTDKVCMVGDNMETDIKFGFNNEIATLLVLSGVTPAEKVANLVGDRVPTHVQPKLWHVNE